MRLPGMLHARVVRQPSPTARDCCSVDTTPSRICRAWSRSSATAAISPLSPTRVAGIKALRALAAAAEWNETARAAGQGDAALDPLSALPARRHQCPDLDRAAAGSRSSDRGALHQAVSHARLDRALLRASRSSAMTALTVWTHTQGVFPAARSPRRIARLPPEKVRCIHVEGSGCYGHNGADDVAADAALIARACRVVRFACNGCASRRTPPSRSGRPW